MLRQSLPGVKMRSSISVAAVLVSFVLVACSPTVSDQQQNFADSGANAGVDANNTGCTTTEAQESSCFDGVDNDCDGIFDCSDPDCADTCANQADAGTCGEAVHGGQTLAIPDGVGMSYETSLTISGFDPGQTMTDLNTFLGACVTMEHSWLRDLQIELICPSGQVIVLNEFLGTTGGEIYMGEPNDSDGTDPIPGVGYNYCWRPSATNPPMLDWANANPLVGTLPVGDYQASDAYAPLLGCELNGVWTIRATDDWGIDNGFIFDWSVEFDQSIIPDCDDFKVE